MKRVAVFGGTFNPIHKGHLHLMEGCDEALGFDEILLMPSAIPPHKQAKMLVSGEHRLAMCRLATAHLPKVQVSDLEIQRTGRSYTVDTVTELTRTLPDTELFLVVGGDMCLTFHQWYRYQTILENATVVAAARTPMQYEAMAQYLHQREELQPHFILLSLPVLEISSTQIREDLTGAGAKYLDPAVHRYIKQHQLYQK